MELSLRDTTFRGICEDLVLALTELEKLERQPSTSAAAKVDEFRTLVNELEGEILAYLARHDHT